MWKSIPTTSMRKQQSARCAFAHLQVPVFSANNLKNNNCHKEFQEVIVVFSLHVDSVTICQVSCRNDIYALIKYPTAPRQSIRRNLCVCVCVRVCFCVEPMLII